MHFRVLGSLVTGDEEVGGWLASGWNPVNFPVSGAFCCVRLGVNFSGSGCIVVWQDMISRVGTAFLRSSIALPREAINCSSVVN